MLPLPSKQALDISNTGISDGEICRIAPLPQVYPNLIMVPVAIFQLQVHAYTLDKDIKFSHFSELQGYRIGGLGGVVLLEREFANMDFYTTRSIKSTFDELLEGKFDIAIAAKLSGLYHLAEQDRHHIQRHDPPLLIEPLYHYLHKNHQHLVPAITSRLKAMYQGGEIQKIRQAYEQALLIYQAQQDHASSSR